MTRRLSLALLFGATALAHAYPRSDLPSLTFSHKDWELACDNTRTCRAAGYSEDDGKPGASILLTRRAGPNQPVEVALQLAENPDDAPLPPVLRMSIDGRELGTVQYDSQKNGALLSAAQTQVMLPALLKSGRIAWSAGRTTWTISTAGATAVLLKMDDFQGRVDTPGALARKGKKPESSVLPPLPLPVVRAAPVPPAGKPALRLSSREQGILVAQLRKTVQDGECDLLDKPGAWSFDRLADGKVLVSHACWQAAYNTGDGFWVIDARAPYSPVLVTTSASTYDNGVIESVQKGRGIGDCMGMSTWTWDGRSFSQTLQQTTGMCRGIAAGGAWELPTLVARVVRGK